MKNTLQTGAAVAETKYVENDGRKIAYRIIGDGTPIIWCNRFRGIMDDWDPAFIDGLAGHFSVIIFDYSGVGLSTGELATEIALVAKDVKDLANGLGLKQFIIGGWSYGGAVAQTFSTRYPTMITLTILIGTTPPGKNEFQPEPLFLEVSSHLENGYEDQVILFFEPLSVRSRQAALASLERIAQRTTDKDIPVPESVWGRYFQGIGDYAADDFNAREKLGSLQTRVLVISGDHDLVCPVENWYALTRKMTNLFLVVLPESGHGPQHQYPTLAINYIVGFVQQ